MLANFSTAVGMSLGKQSRRRADLSWRAVATLEGVVLDEGGLQRMQLGPRGQALNGGDLSAIARHRQHEAGIDPHTVDRDRARTALAVIAAFFGAGKLQTLAQQVRKVIHGLPRARGGLR
jgi:hypothetical protein